MRIDEVMRRHAGHTLLRIVTAVTGPVRAVPDYLILHAEAVIDEAVRHLVAHPGADTVVVTVSVTPTVTVVVEATGPVGIILPPLLGSSARARLLGGHCAVEAVLASSGRFPCLRPTSTYVCARRSGTPAR